MLLDKSKKHVCFLLRFMNQTIKVCFQDAKNHNSTMYHQGTLNSFFKILMTILNFLSSLNNIKILAKKNYLI